MIYIYRISKITYVSYIIINMTSENIPRPTLCSINRLPEEDILKFKNENNYNTLINKDYYKSSNINNISNSEELNAKLIETQKNIVNEINNKVKFHKYLNLLLIFQLIFIATTCYLLKKFNYFNKFINNNLLEITCLLLIITFGFIIISASLEIQIMKKYKYIIYFIHLLYLTFISYIITIKYNTNIIIISCGLSIIILFCNLIAIKDILLNCTNICFILCVFAFMFIFSGFTHIFKWGLTDIELIYINICTFSYVWYMTYNIKLLFANNNFSNKDYIICSIYIYYNFINIMLNKCAILC